jgi:transmembrane sensor
MNNILPRQPDPAADEAASLWAARLEGGTLSAADRDALDAWLNADASHRVLLSRYCQFSADLEEQLLALVATGSVKLPPEPATETPAETAPALAPVIKVSRWNFPRIASVAVAAAAIALAVWIARPTPRIETIATAAAQRSAVTLPDSTRVELNARTSLTFELASSERRARLAAGEAFFTVAKDKARPFVIETPAGSVRVTGTVFNVRTDSPADLAVTVVEGSVQVRPGEPAATRNAAPYALTANDRLVALNGVVKKESISAGELDDTLAWREGKIVFRDVPLREALDCFARYHGKGIIPSSGVTAITKTLGGRFSIDDLEGFLTGLEETFDVRITHETNGTIRVSRRNEP